MFDDFDLDIQKTEGSYYSIEAHSNLTCLFSHGFGCESVTHCPPPPPPPPQSVSPWCHPDWTLPLCHTATPCV